MALILAALAACATSMRVPAEAEFSRSYAVWASFDDGRCIYFLTDAGLNAAQLTDELRGGYQKDAGLEILTSADTPARCVSKARRAALRAGFSAIRARRGTERDRQPGIP
jgi:hypothetical protein